jgi:outer membrane receptor protein involved in Fe transport
MSVLGAAEAMGNNGPWEQPEHLRRQNLLLRASDGTNANGYALTAMAYQAEWIATEHVPERAITNGEIGRYGTLGSTDGGRTHRYSLSGTWTATGDTGSRRASAYVVDYGLNLFSTPSGLLDGQHEQADQRLLWGGQGAQSWFLGPEWKDTEATLGAQFRQDRVGRLGLYQTVDRARMSTVREDRVIQSALGIYGEARTQWTDRLRSTLGLRWDGVRAQVTPLGGALNNANGGTASATQVSPKLGLVFGPFGNTEYYANWGRGFHSNDARGATTRINVNDGSPVETVPLLVKATGGEVGLRTALLPGWQASLSLWRMDLASELVFIGDAGVTEPKGGSRRHGLEWANYYTDGKGLIVDADLALSQARFKEATNGGTHVPNAIPATAALGVAFDPGSAWFGGLRLRYLGAYALEETGTQKSTPFWTANLKLGYRPVKGLQFTLDVLNLFGRKANDIEYWGASCTTAEGPGCNGGAGVDGRMLHPLEPRTLRVGMRMSFD